jgi:hypothetical protein
MIMPKNSLYDKLESFSKLQPDWDGYGADPISNLTIDNTRNLLSKLKGDWEIFPVNNGAIQVEKEKNEYYIEIEVYDDKFLYLLMKNGIGQDEKKFKLNEIDDLIKEIEK